MAGGNTFLTIISSGIAELRSAISTFTGNANEIISTNGSGVIDNSLLPSNLGSITVAGVTAVGTVTAGEFVQIFDNTGTLSVRTADGPLGIYANGFVTTTIPDTTTGTVFQFGENNSVAGLTPGVLYHLGAAGALTTTPDVATAGAVVQLIGTAQSATNIPFEGQDDYYLINL